MAIGAFLEPGVVVSLLAGGTIVNRDRSWSTSSTASAAPISTRRPYPWKDIEYGFQEDNDDATLANEKSPESRSRSSSTSTVWHDFPDEKTGGPSRYRTRTLRFFGREYDVTSPNTEVFKDRFLSRVLRQYPFLVEVWYWALIYWVCTHLIHDPDLFPAYAICVFHPPPYPNIYCRSQLA